MVMKSSSTSPIPSDDKRKSDYIKQYVDAGFRLTPLFKKKPSKLNWTKTRYNPNLTSAQLPGNYGVVLDDCHLVVDVDPRRFNKGDNPLIRLCDDFGIPRRPDTFTVQTGGEIPGLHLYFRKPEGIRIKELHPQYEGLEFKTIGRQVVGVGSIHPDTGVPYRPASSKVSVSDIKDAPEELIQFLKAQSSAASRIDGKDHFSEDPGLLQQFRRYLGDVAPVSVQGCGGDTTAYKVACKGRDIGLPVYITHELMLDFWNDRCAPPWAPDELLTKVKNAYRYATSNAGVSDPREDFKGYEDIDLQSAALQKERNEIHWEKDKNGVALVTLGNTTNFFRNPGPLNQANPLYKLLRYNEFADRIEFTYAAPWHEAGRHPGLWTDDDCKMFQHWLSYEKHYNVSEAMCYSAAVVYAQRYNRYHPVLEYLDSLIWDGVSRVDKFLPKYTGADDNKYVRTVGRCTLIGAVQRIYRPGSKFDTLLVLEGKQGTGKSTLCQVLGGPWYSDIQIDPKNEKETVSLMNGTWIAESSEMVVVKQSDVQALKRFLSKLTDKVRPVYQKTAREFPRQCIFIGTVNPDRSGTYLRDATGNRRFWPVKTRKILLEELQADRDQLWAEAVHLYKNGAVSYITDESINTMAEQEQASRMTQDPWVSVIVAWTKACLKETNTVPIMSLADISQRVIGLPVRGLSRVEAVRLANALSLADWIKLDETDFAYRPEYEDLTICI